MYFFYLINVMNRNGALRGTDGPDPMIGKEFDSYDIMHILAHIK